MRGAAGGMAAALRAAAQEPGERPARDDSVTVLNPRDRVPVSWIIDDSTCLVNLNRFAIPQFAAAYNYEQYHHDWRSMPYEIPDDFVRRFGEWCAEKGVKGKYSIVPYPACVGRLDRELPGWTAIELRESIRLVQSLMMPNWDIHPEMVTHTRVIDLKTGHPYPERSLRFMENWDWTEGRSADELTAYMIYALEILKNVGLPCEGITTPGGFGQQVMPELARATLDSCREVFQAEIPHYFRDVYRDPGRSVAPLVQYASGLKGTDPRCVVSIIGCTGDWTGGWDCSAAPQPDLFITPDLTQGRLVEVIDRGEPAFLVSHWTGIHFNGRELGFRAFQEVFQRLHAKYDNLVWMKNSEIARYWAARQLTAISRRGQSLTFQAPFACPAFTVRFRSAEQRPPRFSAAGAVTLLTEARDRLRLVPGTWFRQSGATIACFDLPRGPSELLL